jgi:hypothetical protein
MLDFPQDHQKVMTEEHQTVKNSSSIVRPLLKFDVEKSQETSKDPYIQTAKTIMDSLHQTLGVASVYDVFNKTYEFVKQQQGMSLADQKEAILQVINYIIDSTDTPYLPDSFTDPVFKAFAPTLLDLFLEMQGTGANLIPVMSNEKPSQQTFQNYIKSLKASYADGFQLSDIALYIEKTVVFSMGFTNLTEKEKIDASVEIINTIIDNLNFGPLPSLVTAPILKTFTRPLVELIFSKV